MTDKDYDWYVRNLQALAKSGHRWRKLLKAAKRSDSIEDLEELRGAAETIHDPPLLIDKTGLASQIEELVGVINARLRKLNPPPVRPAPPPRSEPPGIFQGRDYRVVFGEAMALKRAKKFGEAEVLFSGALDAFEADIYVGKAFPIIDNYLQLAIVQRALGDTKGEVRTLERCLRQTGNDEVRGRLERLRKKMGQ